MPKEQFGSTQVFEVRFHPLEIKQIVLDHLRQVCSSYDFDYANPITLQLPQQDLIFRFVQGTITGEGQSRQMNFPTIQALIDSKAKKAAVIARNEKALAENATPAPVEHVVEAHPIKPVTVGNK